MLVRVVVQVLVECATELMRRPDLVGSPLVHAKLAEMLMHMLGSAGRGANRGLGTGVDQPLSYLVYIQVLNFVFGVRTGVGS